MEEGSTSTEGRRYRYPRLCILYMLSTTYDIQRHRIRARARARVAATAYYNTRHCSYLHNNVIIVIIVITLLYCHRHHQDAGCVGVVGRQTAGQGGEAILNRLKGQWVLRAGRRG